MSAQSRPPFDPARDLWVIGCIDSNGSISARVDDGTFPNHQENEQRGHRWRWQILKQSFAPVMGATDLTNGELAAVLEWLTRRGYRKERRGFLP